MPEWTNEQKKERVRRRIKAATDPDNYYYTPEKQSQQIKADEFQRVAIYARVSTDDPAQTSSFELQQKYYEDLVARHPKWVMVKIYSDEGKSGTTTAHREGFLEMIDDAFAGKIDLIIVKNISRLARNVVDFLSVIRRLAEKKIGVLFESEAIYSLNSNSHLALTFQATLAEEESRIRSRSMETSLRMRLDHGLPLTPELLGFVKDENGKLMANPETKDIPKLMFWMYLFGFSTAQIADTLTKLSRKTYLGNMKWSAGGVARTLQNERYCGDVLTRKRFKVFAPDAGEQKSFKNQGERPQSYYRGEHEAIISRDDFIGVQRIMRNAKYGGTSLLPELKVIPEGLLRGFVIVHPKWASFTANDYINASLSVPEEEAAPPQEMGQGEAFDLSGYEIADFKLFEERRFPAVLFAKDYVQFNASCIQGMACGSHIEMLVHPGKKMVAIRPSTAENRYGMRYAKGFPDDLSPRQMSCKAFIDQLFQVFGWNRDYKYKLYGQIYRDGKDVACIFSESDASVFIKKKLLENVESKGKLLGHRGDSVRAFPGGLSGQFGNDYYSEKSRRELALQTREEWQTQIEGRMCASGDRLNVTDYETLREFIKEQLGELFEEPATPPPTASPGALAAPAISTSPVSPAVTTSSVSSVSSESPASASPESPASASDAKMPKEENRPGSVIDSTPEKSQTISQRSQ